MSKKKQEQKNPFKKVGVLKNSCLCKIKLIGSKDNLSGTGQ